jgi:predicted DNA-binding transcriptional regulator AlpA
MSDQITIPETGFLRLHQILRIIPVGKSTWWAGVKSGRFPKPVKLGPRTTAWKAEVIADLVKSFGGDEGDCQ